MSTSLGNDAYTLRLRGVMKSSSVSAAASLVRKNSLINIVKAKSIKLKGLMLSVGSRIS